MHCKTLAPSRQEDQRGRMPVPPQPFHTWGIDLVGPFPKSANGNRFLLTCVDHLTGWAEAIPIPSKKNENVWDALLTHVVSRYGLPSVIVSDNGGEFTATKFKEWMREVGIDHRLSSPYKKSGGYADKWEEYLTDALYAYRVSINTDGFTPFQQVFGQRPRLPRARVPGTTPGIRLRHIKQTARETQAALTRRGDKYRSKQTSKAKNYEVGAYVSLRVQHPTKGTARWKPGFQVIDVCGSALKVQELSTGKTLRVNSQHVREIPNALPYDQIAPRPRRNVPREAVYPEKSDINIACVVYHCFCCCCYL